MVKPSGPWPRLRAAVSRSAPATTGATLAAGRDPDAPPRGVTVRLSTRGWGATASAPLLIAAGFVWRYPEIAVLGASLAAAVLVAVGSVAGVPRLQVTREIEPDRVPRGEPCRVRLRLVRRRRGSIPSDLIAVERCGSAVIEASLSGLRHDRETSVSYDVPTKRRGVVRVGPMRIRRADPFGLITALSDHGGQDEVLVYPKVYAMDGVPRGITRSLDGLDDNVSSGTITFDRLRPYVRGDEMRHVHWRTSARLGELMVREHVEESVPTIVVLLDDRASAYADPDDFEEACDAAASITTSAVRADLTPTLLMTATQRSGPIMDRLAHVTLAADGDAHRVNGIGGVADLARRTGGDTIVLLTGDGPGSAEATAAISALGGPHTTVVIAQLAAGFAAHFAAQLAAKPTADRSASGPRRIPPDAERNRAGMRVPGAIDATGTVQESTTDRVVRLRVPDAGAFASAWQRRYGMGVAPSAAAEAAAGATATGATTNGATTTGATVPGAAA